MQNKKQLFTKLLMISAFLIGGLIAAYPFYVNALNHFIDQRKIAYYEEKREDIEQQRLTEMKEKNKEITKNGLSPGSIPFDEVEEKAETNQSKVQKILTKHLIGKISIPKIDMELSLYDTTTPTILEHGAAVLQGTSYPTGGKGTHSVISAHSGLPNRLLFTHLEELVKGDQFVITVHDEKLAYEVIDTHVVTPDDTSKLTLVPEQDLVTLLTCTPYMINSHRLLVTGKRVPYTEKLKKEVITGNQLRDVREGAILAGMLAFTLLLLGLFVRTIYINFLRKRKIDLVVQLVDEQQQALENILVGLYSKKGMPLKRNQVPYQVQTDSAGYARFTSLPGDVYVLLVLNDKHKTIIGGIKKIKQKPLYKKGKHSELTQLSEHHFIVKNKDKS